MSSGGAFLETYLEKMEQPEKQVAALIRCHYSCYFEASVLLDKECAQVDGGWGGITTIPPESNKCWDMLQ